MIWHQPSGHQGSVSHTLPITRLMLKCPFEHPQRTQIKQSGSAGSCPYHLKKKSQSWYWGTTLRALTCHHWPSARLLPVASTSSSPRRNRGVLGPYHIALHFPGQATQPPQKPCGHHSHQEDRKAARG